MVIHSDVISRIKGV